MTRFVLRLGKRKTSWEVTAASEIIDAEFKDKEGVIDLSPSVYVIEPALDQARATIIRIHTEHAASLLRDPPKGAIDVDLNGITPIEPTRTAGATKFAFANER